MLTSEEVREIEAVMDDPVKRWAMSPGAAITYIEALLEAHAEHAALLEVAEALVELLAAEAERGRAEATYMLPAMRGTKDAITAYFDAGQRKARAKESAQAALAAWKEGK